MSADAPCPGTEREYSPGDFRIDVLDTSFSISADEDPAYLGEVLGQYQAAIKNTREISGLQSPLKTAILTGFLLCDEINKLKIQAGQELEQVEAERAGEARELERRTMNLIARIDRVLEENNSGFPPGKME
ncbi:MAG: cell division protein ZapA [Treponema sp.]|jgi:cell division protein ZapA (FtsZ GTPase activity inhibitor)|nr:cell division protein ZapA [Treponema sp.]